MVKEAATPNYYWSLVETMFCDAPQRQHGNGAAGVPFHNTTTHDGSKTNNPAREYLRHINADIPRTAAFISEYHAHYVPHVRHALCGVLCV